LHAGLGFVDQWREIGQRALWLSQFAKGWRDYRRDCKKLAAA
jgi:hypothetical protein